MFVSSFECAEKSANKLFAQFTTNGVGGGIDGFISAFLKWESLGRPQVKGGEME